MSSPLRQRELFQLQGKVALVTGGGTGIGFQIASGFAVNGAVVYIGGRRKDVVERAATGFTDREAGGQLIGIELDVTNKESIAKAVKLIGEKHGKLDILVNNAGQVGPTSPFLSKPDAPENASISRLSEAMFAAESFEDWAKLFSINVSTIYFVTVAFLDLLDKASKADGGEAWGPSVTNISSISGGIGLSQDHFCYNASKAAANHLTKMMSTEFALRNVPIRVNAIAPGAWSSEMTYVTPGGEMTEEMVASIGKGIKITPAKRAGREGEMAGTALYLASRSGYYTNGQIITVDGGYMAVNP